MKKKVLSLTAALLLITGCGKIPTLSNGQEAVVSFENGEMISVDELYEKLKDEYALSSLISMIDKHVLESKFPSYVKKAKEYAESYMDALRQNYDSEDELLSAIQSYTGMSSIAAYQDSMYINYLQSYATEEYSKSLVSDKDVEKYYNNTYKEPIDVSHILITSNVTDKMTADEKKKAESEAKDKANEVLSKLKAASKDEVQKVFEDLAKEYSQDSANASKGGALGKINIDSLPETYDELVKAAYSVKDGEYYKEVVTTELGYHIVLRTKTYEKEKLDDVKETLRSTIAKKTYGTSTTISYEALEHYRKEMGMNIEDSTLKTQYAYYMNNLLTSLKENQK